MFRWQGDVVAITMANTIEFIVSFMAANWIGAAAMPLVRLNQQPSRHILRSGSPLMGCGRCT